jgi:hypothetical protein
MWQGPLLPCTQSEPGGVCLGLCNPGNVLAQVIATRSEGEECSGQDLVQNLGK